jgi:hypothetical protein
MPIVTNENKRPARFTKGVRATFVVEQQTLDAVETLCEQASIPPSVFYRLVARAIIREGGPAQLMHYINQLPVDDE